MLSTHPRRLSRLAICSSLVLLSTACGKDEPEAEDTPMAESAEALEEALAGPHQGIDELEASVEKTKAELARLGERLARAQMGSSPEVLEARKKLRQAMEEQHREVEAKIQAAARAARRYSALYDRAAELLERSAPPNVEADVEMEIKRFSRDISERLPSRPSATPEIPALAEADEEDE